MTAARALISALIAGGMDPADAAALLTQAAIEVAGKGSTSGAERTRRWRERHKASQSVTEIQPARRDAVTSQASQSVTSDVFEFPALILKKEKKEDIRKERKKERADRVRKHPLPADFFPKPSHYQAASELNLPESAVLEKAEDMRIWAQSSGELKADWDATLHGFMRRDAKRSRGPPFAGQSSNGFSDVHRELRERMDAKYGNDVQNDQADSPNDRNPRLI